MIGMRQAWLLCAQAEKTKKGSLDSTKMAQKRLPTIIQVIIFWYDGWWNEGLRKGRTVFPLNFLLKRNP